MTIGRELIRFGIFEVNLETGEVRRAGVRVRLQEQPFQVLAALLAKPGEIVTKEELQERIWKDDTFVDFDRSLATAVNKVRQALGDSATRPRFIETVAKRGYRFIGGLGDQQPHSSDDPLPADKVVAGRRLLLGLKLVCAILTVLLLASLFLGTPENPTAEKLIRRFSMSPEGLTSAAISPDGRYIAYGAVGPNGRHQLWVYAFETETALALPGTEGLLQPAYSAPDNFFWAADSLSLAFAAGSEIKSVTLDGSSPFTICRLPGPALVGGAWNTDSGQIVFSSGGQIYLAASRGGEPSPIVERDVDTYWLHPQFLPTRPDRSIIFSGGNDLNNQSIVVLNLDTGERRELGIGNAPVYTPAGYLVFARGPVGEPDLWAVSFSLDELLLAGEPFRIADSGYGATVSLDGTLLYNERSGTRKSILVWRNRTGELLETDGQPQEGLREVILSPDGTAAAVIAGPLPAPDIWIHDFSRSAVRRLTFSDPGAYFPAWNPSGRELVYTTVAGIAMMRRAADGEGGSTKLADRGGYADWSPDGRYVVYHSSSGAAGELDLHYIEFDQDGVASKPVRFYGTSAREAVPQIAPNGNYVAYVSDESGRPEVYVLSFPSGSGKWQVSSNGGVAPRWNPNGSELFFVEDRAMLVSVSTSFEDGFTFGSPQRLFESGSLVRRDVWPQYDVSPDGQRFLLPEPYDEDGDPSAVFRIVENWYEEFRDPDDRQ